MPLTFLTEALAVEYVRSGMEATGCYGGARAVRFDIAQRLPAEVWCTDCGEWGHEEASCPEMAAECCVCGSREVAYRNFQDKPFCGPCANGEPPGGSDLFR